MWVSVLCLRGHKEDETAKKIALHLAAELNANVLAVVGVHYNYAVPKMINNFEREIDSIIKEIIIHLSQLGYTVVPFSNLDKQNGEKYIREHDLPECCTTYFFSYDRQETKPNKRAFEAFTKFVKEKGYVQEAYQILLIDDEIENLNTVYFRIYLLVCHEGKLQLLNLNLILKMLQNQNRIAKPSGKLCIAKPIDTIIPVFNNLLSLLFVCILELNFLSTNKSQKIIAIIPKIVPISTSIILLISRLSGIKSKHITAIINPDAKANIKLKNLFDFLFKKIPKIPPSVVPNVPKNNPKSVVFNISINKKLLTIYLL